jgi:hypothetical protein
VTTASIHVPAIPHPSVTAAPSSHSIVLTRIVPPQGVMMALDDGPPARVQSGDSVTVDTAKEHVVVFTCAQNLCVPERRSVPAGTKEESLSVELRIRPAILVVKGDPTKEYVIVEQPQISVQVGQGVNVPASSGADFDVTVKEVLSDKAKTVTLHPGQTSTVSFL